jgi:hypothetical protein
VGTTKAGAAEQGYAGGSGGGGSGGSSGSGGGGGSGSGSGSSGLWDCELCYTKKNVDEEKCSVCGAKKGTRGHWD